MADKSYIDPYTPPARPTEAPVANVFELLDRILDKGLVIVGDIRVSVADIELLKIQIRLLIASVDTAKKMGIDFSWAKLVEQPKTKLDLEQQIQGLEKQLSEHETVASSDSTDPTVNVGTLGSNKSSTDPPTNSSNDSQTDHSDVN